MSKDQQYRFGFVALLGRPNVGKSTLLNRMVGKKISITSDRPQTTRHRILGIVSDKNKQIVFVDTPGVHSISQKTQKKRINKIINRTAVASIDGVDLVLFMVTAKGWKPADEVPLKALQDNNVPVIVVINKLDLLANKNQLLPQIEDLQQRINCVAVIPVSASKGNNVQHLMDEITSRLPEGQAHFDSKQITDRTQSFLVSEMIREQLFRLLGDELPYATAVELQRIELIGKTYHIAADIWVDKASQKAIVIGKQGAKLKQIGSKSRLPIQQLLGKKVFLELYVKVRSGWADRQQDLQSLGYDEGQ